MEQQKLTTDEWSRTEAWWRLKAHFTAGDFLGTSVPHKAGHNDLSRWRAFGGTLDRPAPPAPMRPSHGPIMGFPMPAYCAVPVFVGLDLADSGGFSPDAGS